MSLESKKVNINQIVDININKTTADKNDSPDLTVRNDTDRNIPTEAFVPGKPLGKNAIWENARQTRRDGAGVDTVQDAITADRQNSDDSSFYTVKSGDTMWDIAESLRDTGNYSDQTVPEIVQNVADYNGIADPNKIYVGQKIYFPPIETCEEAPIITPENIETPKTDTTKAETNTTTTQTTDTTLKTEQNQPTVNTQNVQNATVINNNYFINGVRANQPPQINDTPQNVQNNGINNSPTYGDQVIIVIVNNNQAETQPVTNAKPTPATSETPKGKKSNYITPDAFKKGKKSFSWGNLFSNIGKGIWNEVKGIGKALLTPTGFLTAAGLIGVSLLFPVAGLVIAGGFLAYGAAKTGIAGYEIAKDYSDGKYEEAEKHGQDLGAGLFDTALAAIGFRGALNSVKASRAASAAAKASGGTMSEAATGSVTSNTKALPPTTKMRALPAPEGTTAAGTGSGGGAGGGTGGAGNVKALPNGSTTGSGSQATGTGTGTPKSLPKPDANTSVKGAKGNVNTANTSSMFTKFKGQIDGAENVRFVDYVGNRPSASTVKNPYKVLGLDKKNFDPVQLKSNYRTLSRLFHPDKNPGLSDTYMQNINKAYEILSDPLKKANLDQALR